MNKIDFKKTLKHLYVPSDKDFVEVEVPTMSFLMIDGIGDPNTSEEYKLAVEALYALAYAIKFMSKRELGKDYGVAPLEGLWTSDDMGSFITRDKNSWQWTMMIMQPEWITKEIVDQAIESVKLKKNPTALSKTRFETFSEGRSLQILHVGSYDDEAPTLKKLHGEFMPEHGLIFNGRHHEIYLSDPRKTDSQKLKTVLRQPVTSK